MFHADESRFLAERALEVDHRVHALLIRKRGHSWLCGPSPGPFPKPDQAWLINIDQLHRISHMEYVKVQYAKTHLSALLASVEAGQEIVISRGERPVARLVPVEAAGARDLGFVAYRVPDGFFDPLPEEELTAWEGGE